MASSLPLRYEITPNIRINSDDSKFIIDDKLRTMDPNNQSVDVGGGVRRNAAYTDGLLLTVDAETRTVYDIFKNSIAKYGERPCMGWREKQPDGKPGPFVFSTYREVGVRIHDIAAGIRSLDVQPGAHIGIYSKNRIEWQLVASACDSQSMASVALYDTLGDDATLYIINHAGLEVVFCSNECLAKTLKAVSQAPCVRYVVCFDKFAAADEEKLTSTGSKARLLSLPQLEQQGRDKPVADVPPTPDTLYTIMYTSGTTGTPKGVMVSHRNMVATVSSAYHQLEGYLGPNEEDPDCLLSFLPLAHILERAAENIFYMFGGRVGFYSGDVKLLRDDIQALKPNLFAGVPRIFDRFYDAVKENTTDPKKAGWLKRWLFSKAYEAKKQARLQGEDTPIWNYLVFSKLQEMVGGKVRLMFSGGAPLRPEVQEYLAIAFNLACVQGYGLTEGCAATCIQMPSDIRANRAGGPIPCVEIKLADVPELGYYSKNQQGEVCMRGPSITLGYYKDPAQTKEVFDDDGFFKTGDIGQWNEDGSLTLIDRKKNIFKLAQGEYVAVENIEMKLSQSPLVPKVWLYGDSFKTCLVAVGAINPDTFLAFAKQEGFANATKDDLPNLCKEQKLRKAIVKSLSTLGHSLGLKGFELPRSIVLLTKPFEEAVPHCITPSMKFMRSELKKTFESDIQTMYRELGEQR